MMGGRSKKSNHSTSAGERAIQVEKFCERLLLLGGKKKSVKLLEEEAFLPNLGTEQTRSVRLRVRRRRKKKGQLALPFGRKFKLALGRFYSAQANRPGGRSEVSEVMGVMVLIGRNSMQSASSANQQATRQDFQAGRGSGTRGQAGKL